MTITLSEADICEACRQWLFFRGLKVEDGEGDIQLDGEVRADYDVSFAAQVEAISGKSRTQTGGPS
jgi:hypothetical protein